MIRAGRVDIVRSGYILESVAARRLVALMPHHVIHATNPTMQAMRVHIDVYGDSFFDDIIDDNLKEVCIC